MSTQELFRSDYLFSDMNFIIGMGSILNITGNYYHYNESDTPEESDFKAISSDWGAVGKDLKFALKKYIENSNESKK
jgi:hypothetical protein